MKALYLQIFVLAKWYYGTRNFYSGIIRDITERKEVELRVSEFYSTVSHELRTPLTSIRGALGFDGRRSGW